MDTPKPGFIARKKRRRRRQDRPALSAHLFLDERLKDEVGVLSEDLFADLFPAFKNSSVNNGDDTSRNRVHHVAITPWLPGSLTSTVNVPWTIVPVRAPAKSDTSEKRPHSSLRFSTSSLALQSFVHLLQSTSPNKLPQRRDTAIEIRILDVVPIGLDTVFVTLDAEALKTLDQVHAKFGGGFGTTLPNDSKTRRGSSTDANSRTEQALYSSAPREWAWKHAVRDALKAPKLVHAGDLLPLPLPAHPITHVPPPPAKITACEPVAQGLLLPSTRIVIIQSQAYSKSAKALPPVTAPPIPDGIDEDGEDTSNEQFYSAAEERTLSQGPSPPDEGEQLATDGLESELSGTEADDLSDDTEDMISLSAPTLPPQSSGVLSSFTSATPRPGGFQTNGIATPGSVLSSFTTTTVRGSGPRSKLFRAQGLLERIPDELLHPKPSSEDDEEARIFVDTNALVKIGCFSGDWVQVEAAAESPSNEFGAWGLGSFAHEDENTSRWRAVKIFGLPEIMSRRTSRYPVNKVHDQRSSFSIFVPGGTTAPVYLSPVLLANLGGPTHLRLSALVPHTNPGLSRSSASRPRITNISSPPFAKEVTLLKVSTPLSTDRLLQPSLFAGLKEYFEQKRRIVKSGDLVGISIDETLARAVFQGASGEDAGDELLSRSKDDSGGANIDRRPDSTGVAWFKVGNVTTLGSKEESEDDPWGGITTVDATNTKMVQAGSEQGKLPPALNSSWQYYLGVKRPPASTQSPPNKGIAIVDIPKPYVSPLRRRLRELISAATSPRAIHLGLPPLAILLTSTQRQIGKVMVATKACEDLGLHTFTIDSFDILTEGGAGGGDVKTEAFLKARAERALTCGAEFTALLLKHVEALNADRMVTALKEVLADLRVLIATTTEVDKVPDGIRGLFTHELEMTAPDEGEREGILRGIVEDSGVRLAPDVDLAGVAVKTAALVAGDLVDVIDRAVVAKRTRLEQLASTAAKVSPSDDAVTVKDLELAGGSASHSLTKPDLDAAVDAARKNFADAIGAPKIPNVSWSDVGGLTHVKDAVMETIQLPLSRPELFAKGMKKRSGILFYGPPGTGKTLLAKAIATEFSLNFFSVKGPELLNMYIGESEANVRRVFQRARDARPCVVFFDELDSVAPKRGNQGDSGGVMDRIVSQLLAELDGMSDGEEGGGGVFVIGATNRPDLLDQALLRPGRFDKMLYLGVSDTHEKQLTILEALTRKFTLDPNLSLRAIASTLPFTYTGADLYALCSDAMLKAITRQASRVDQKVAEYNATHPGSPISIAYFFDHLATDEDTAVMVNEEDFIAAKRELVPSVSVDELRHYERVRTTFEGSGRKGEREEEEHNQHAHAQAVHAGRTNGLRSVEQRGVARNKAKGKGKGKGKLTLPAHNDEPSDDDDVRTVIRRGESDEDDFVVRSEHGKVNGIGKGKGKMAASGGSLDGFGDAAGMDEKLYS